MKLSLSTNAAAVATRLSGRGAALRTGIDLAMRRATLEVRAEAFRAMSRPSGGGGFWGPRTPAGPYLGVRSGQTRRQLSPGRTWQVLNRWFGIVTHPGRHVAAMEKGQTIQARGRYLRIPTAAALTGAGVDRFAGRSARSPRTFIIRSRAGNLWIAERGPSGSLTLLYLLRRSVRLPAKHLFREVAARVRPRVLALLRGHVTLSLRGA